MQVSTTIWCRFFDIVSTPTSSLSQRFALRVSNQLILFSQECWQHLTLWSYKGSKTYGHILETTVKAWHNQQNNDFTVGFDWDDMLKTIEGHLMAGKSWRELYETLNRLEKKEFASIDSAADCLGIFIFLFWLFSPFFSRNLPLPNP